MLSRFSHVQLCDTLWTVATRLPCPWDSPGKNPEVGCHFLLQGIFLTQGPNPHLLNWQADSLPLNHLGNPASPGLQVKSCVMLNKLLA